jgi:hypothetical protein
MAGMGMGMATKTKGKKNKKNASNKGMGGKKTSDKFDTAKAMIKSDKLYEKLMADSNRALNAEDWNEATRDITTEYIVTARCKPGSTLAKANDALIAASDWIPVSQLVIVRSVHTQESGTEQHSSVRAAVSYYCREINYAATLAAPIFKSLPRNIIEYSAEPIDSFMKFVYEDVIEGKTSDSFVDGTSNEKVGMTKSKAREMLGLEADCKDASVIKQAYKKQSMALHPDRFVNSDKTKEEIDEFSVRFGLVKMAYEALNSGIRNDSNESSSSYQRSWYESLGGKSRTEFAGAVDLMSTAEAGEVYNKAFKSAVAGLDPDLTMAFVARNQAAAR